MLQTGIYLKKQGEGCVVGWIGLVQDRIEWRALVKTVLNLQFHKEPYST
jgi:hypothetical protein